MIALKESTLFSTLNPIELERVVSTVKEHSFTKGETLIAQGDKQNTLFIIKSGKIDINIMTKSGYKQIEKREKGDQFGELGVFVDNYTAPFTLVISEDVTLLSIDRDDLYDILHNNPSTTVKLVEIFAKQVYKSAQLVENLSKKNEIEL